MADTNPAVSHLPRSLPTEVELRISRSQNPRFTPRELRTIGEHYGRSFAAIVGDDADEKFAILAWLQLRRDGHDLTLDDMDDIVIHVVVDVAVDPTSGMPLSTSPPSATSGE